MKILSDLPLDTYTELFSNFIFSLFLYQTK